MAKTRTLNKRKQDLIFYIIMLAYPVLQFAIFYVGVNFNSILMAFQYFSRTEGAMDIYDFYTGADFFKNFTTFFDRFDTEPLFQNGYLFKNAFIAYGAALLFTTPVSIIFSYYIFKKYPLHGMMKVVLFTPSIICGMVLVTIYKKLVDVVIPDIFGVTGLLSLLSPPSTQFNTILFYCIWLGFGGGILLYVGAMNNISDSVIEACKLDGANTIQEMYYIVLPLIYPTFVTFLVCGVGGILTNQMGLYSFKGATASDEIQTFGYWFFKETKAASAKEYPGLAAIGILMTLIVAPITLAVKWALEKYGPKID